MRKKINAQIFAKLCAKFREKTHGVKTPAQNQIKLRKESESAGRGREGEGIGKRWKGRNRESAGRERNRESAGRGREGKESGKSGN